MGLGVFYDCEAIQQRRKRRRVWNEAIEPGRINFTRQVSSDGLKKRNDFLVHQSKRRNTQKAGEVKRPRTKNMERPASGEEKGPRGESLDRRGECRGFVWLRGASSSTACNSGKIVSLGRCQMVSWGWMGVSMRKREGEHAELCRSSHTVLGNTCTRRAGGGPPI